MLNTEIERRMQLSLPLMEEGRMQVSLPLTHSSTSFNPSTFEEQMKSARNQYLCEWYKAHALRERALIPVTDEAPLTEDDSDEVEIGESSSIVVPEWLRSKAQIPFYRKPVESGMEYIVAMPQSASRTWSLAKVVAIIHNVHVKENRCVVVFGGVNAARENVPLSQLAYEDVCQSVIPVGTSVVTRATSMSSTRFYVGVVVEAPCATNNFRYLVYFESGCCSYANHDDLRVTCAQYQCQMSRYDRYLIKDITSTAPERQQQERLLLRFKVGEIAVAKQNGKWVEGCVREVDASLVKIEFTKDNPVWYYRGSYRFRGILESREFLPLAKGHLRKLRASHAQLALEFRGSQSPQNELSSENCLAVPSSSTKFNSQPSTSTQLITPLFLYNCYPRDRGLHRCDEECVADENLIDTINPTYGPLLKPLCVGFRRTRQGTRHYIAPCGRVLRSFVDVKRFLLETKTSFTCENFDFSEQIDVQRVYEPKNVLASIADISQGKEKNSISCVNEVSDRLPEDITYEVERSFAFEPLQRMNTDGNFVSCCSCLDDCRDRSKCECAMLTTNSYLEIGEDAKLEPSEVGYRNKRLKNEVRSGIYECNARCPCSSKCPNRLAQFPVKSQLQVFYTGKKGWGVRALHDLPAGTFVCVYVGKLLNEKEANAFGVLHGDEYFADLDFIKIQESRKPGYEEEAEVDAVEPAPEPTSSLPDASRPKRKSKQDCTTNKRAKRKRCKAAAFPKNSLRHLYPSEYAEYVMDAKKKGNVGRFFNHSCEPNLFVQNVFVDTHDLRFPWIAFFAKSDIPAGVELTWDYNYDVGSVRGRRLYCYCLSPTCKRRLY